MKINPFEEGNFIRHKSSTDLLWYVNHVTFDKLHRYVVNIRPVYNPVTHPDLALQAVDYSQSYTIERPKDWERYDGTTVLRLEQTRPIKRKE